MLTPQTLAKLPDEIVDLINDLQTEIIMSIAKKLVKADYLTPSAEWQLYKAQQLRMSTKEVNALISRFTGLSRRKVAKLYTDGCMEAISNDAKIYRAYGKDVSSALRSIALNNTLRAGIKNANGMTRNLCKSLVESSRSTVTYLMDKAYIKTVSGAFSYQEAIYDSVKELAERGIRSVQYPSGHRDWADVAVRRAVMTGISQTAGQMQLDLAAEMDCDLVEVTSHIGARPSHAEWQGKIFSISGKHKKYPKLSTATGYGTGDGLKGWNCRHDFFPFFEGISERVQVPVNTKENKEFYEKEQRQRAMERTVRASKRSLAALDSAIQETDDPELKARLQSDFDRKSATLKKQENRLAEWCKENDLYPQNDRIRVVGFGRSVSQKAVHGAKRYDKAKEEETEQKRTKPDSTGQKGTKPDKAVEVTVPADQSEGLKYADVPITGRKSETFEKKVDNSGESDIMEVREMKRSKDRGRRNIRAISDDRFDSLTIEARKNGAIIMRGGEEVESHLDEVGADASTIGDILLFRSDVCISEVLEETHHFMQNRSGLNADVEEPLRTILNEIEAKRYLLANARKYGVPRTETELTEKQLAEYLKQLEDYKRR